MLSGAESCILSSLRPSEIDELELAEHNIALNERLIYQVEGVYRLNGHGKDGV